jgi:hypothetical protein
LDSSCSAGERGGSVRQGVCLCACAESMPRRPDCTFVHKGQLQLAVSAVVHDKRYARRLFLALLQQKWKGCLAAICHLMITPVLLQLPLELRLLGRGTRPCMNHQVVGCHHACHRAVCVELQARRLSQAAV